jgi:tRNA modification GTPase
VSPPEAFDTICAIATPAGTGGIGIIRVSGPAAIESVERIFQSSSEKKLRKAASHTLHHGTIRDPVSGEAVDEVLVAVMRRPRTYTKEDTVEVHAHGSPYVLQRILGMLMRESTRLAEPGEFTKRAFLNGRIDLTEAEAVMELIGVRSAAGHRAAMARLQGGLGRRMEDLRDRVGDLVARVEAMIDFPEEGLGDLQRERLRADLDAILQAADGLLATAETGRLAQEGVAVVIAGRPNVGKSSLLNRLLKEDRAIVSTIPGTTRDLIQETIHAEGVPLRIIDTAGLRDSTDALEGEGIKRTKTAIAAADLLLVVVDVQEGLGKAEARLLESFMAEKKVILVANKTDLVPKASERILTEIRGRVPTVAISATRGDGIMELFDLMAKTAIEMNGPEKGEVLIAQVRQRTSLEECCKHLELALHSVEGGFPEDVLAFDLRAALDRLGEITGAVTTEDLLGRIFRNFCIGK